MARFQPEFTTHDSRVFNSLFSRDSAGLAYDKYEQRVREKGLPLLCTPSFADNVKLDLGRPPDLRLPVEKVEKHLKLCRDVAAIVEKDAEAQLSRRDLKDMDAKDIDLYAMYTLPKRATLEHVVRILVKASNEDKSIFEFAPFYLCVANISRILHQLEIARLKGYTAGHVSGAKPINQRLVQEIAVLDQGFLKHELFLLETLKKVVDLTLPPPTTSGDEGREIYFISKLQSETLQNAYAMYAAMLVTKAARVRVLVEDVTIDDDERNRRRAVMNFYEAEASHGMYISGAFGNEAARALAERINPYAKLCGNMVMESISKTFYGGHVSSLKKEDAHGVDRLV